jgi:HlyD family secretion protein
MARAELAGAEAGLALIEKQIEQLTLTAPVDGVVNQILVRQGEVASPGMPLVQVVDTDYLTLTVYVPQARVASISAGDEVRITVDAYPDAEFEGLVSHIAGQAQFTPSNVQTREERVKLVFAVEIQVEDSSGRLKAGMPADAMFGE